MGYLELAADLLKRHEGLKDGDNRRPGLQPYVCPAGKLTIGYGHVILPGEEHLKAGISLEQAEELLTLDIMRVAEIVKRAVAGSPLTGNQLAALVSFVFNIGGPAFSQSTVLRRIKAKDYVIAAEAMLMWTKATDAKDSDHDGDRREKVDLPGLVRRRKEERTLFLTPMIKRS
jgi:lysozyme